MTDAAGGEAPFAETDAFVQRRDEFVEALRKSPFAQVPTPNYAEPFAVVVTILRGELCNGGERHLAALLEFVTQAAYESSDPEIRLRAMAWIAAAADRHAERNKP